MIIGVSGRIGSGKDLVGNIIQYLVENSTRLSADKISFDFFKLNKETGIANYDNSSNWKIQKFANTLKDYLCMGIGCTREQLENQDFKNIELGEEWWYWKLEREGGYGNTLLPYNTDKKILNIYEGLKLVKPTPRLLLQQIGTECFRDIIHPNYWVNALMSEYKTHIENYPHLTKSAGQDLIVGNTYGMGKAIYPNWIITDIRFPNELEAIKKKDGISIRVNGRVLCIDIDGNKQSLTQEEWDKIKKSSEVSGWYFTSEHESETALDKTEFDYTINNNGTIENLIKQVKEILIKEKIIENESI